MVSNYLIVTHHVNYFASFFRTGISNRDCSLSNKNLHKSFIRTVPPYSHQADLWIELLRKLNYQSVIFIHSSDEDGQSTLHRFQNLAHQFNIKIEHIIEYVSHMANISYNLKQTQANFACRVFILYANQLDAERIFDDIQKLNMITAGYVWLVTEQALNAINRLDGIIGPVLKNGHDEAAHIKDSINLVVMALRNLYLSYGNLTLPPNDCNKTVENWETGVQLMNFIKNQTIPNGATGRISFDDNNDRLESDYLIVNIQDGRFVDVGNYTFSDDDQSMRLTLNLDTVLWPGLTKSKPHGYFVDTHLQIATIVEEPFIWADSMPKSGKCPSSSHVICYHIIDGIKSEYCCRGYCIDMLLKLSQEMHFTYDLHIGFDQKFGIWQYENSSKVWDGLVGELVYRKADMVIAPLTINPDRAKVIDFSKPFKYQGIAMLQKKMPKGAKLDSFLQPFQHNLWLLVMLSVHVVAIVLYLLDRFSPLGRFGRSEHNCDLIDEDEKSLNLSSAVLFAWGVLLNSGIGEKTPKSFSARVLGMVWAGFAMIVVASYTANLAAFLVLDQEEKEITGLDDSRLRNPVEDFTYATVRHSAVDQYFRGQVELSNMYRLMEDLNRESAADAIQAVREGNEYNLF